MQKVPELVVQERMSQGKGVKGLKEKYKVQGWSIEEMTEKPNVAVVEDTEETSEMEKFELERNGLLAGRFWRKEWKRKSWTSFRSKKAKERPSEVEVPLRIGGRFAKTRHIE